jgi:hypothetical protein
MMSEQLQFIIVVVFGALCFGGGYLTAFIVTRNKWRDEMVKRGVALQLGDRQMGMGRAAKVMSRRSKIRKRQPSNVRQRRIGAVKRSSRSRFRFLWCFNPILAT